MSDINFDQIVNQLLSGVETIAKNSLNDYVNQAKADGKNYIDNAKEDLLEWTKEVETGSMNRKDIEFLLESDEDLSKMTALKQAGLAQGHIDQFRNSIINLIVGTITGLVKI